MSPPTLHCHPLSSCCQKALIAADVLGVALEQRLLNLGDPAQRDAFLALWPTGKMPLLEDRGRVIAETSIIIEYLQREHAAAGRRLIPDDPGAALEVRLWDRLFDLYVMTPMQACTADLLKPEAERDTRSVEQAHRSLLTAYAMVERQLEQQLDAQPWVVGDSFSLADCAAAPALFYAATYVPLPAQHPRLLAYFERLLAHPAVAAVVAQAQPYFRFYPGRAGLARRFFDPASA